MHPRGVDSGGRPRSVEMDDNAGLRLVFCLMEDVVRGRGQDGEDFRAEESDREVRSQH